MLNLAYAAKLQGDTVPGDYDLARYARELRPGVRWWWGVRKVGERRGAYCYLCGLMVVSWDTRYPMTEAAKSAVIEHRDGEHLAPAKVYRSAGESIEGPSGSG